MFAVGLLRSLGGHSNGDRYDRLACPTQVHPRVASFQTAQLGCGVALDSGCPHLFFAMAGCVNDNRPWRQSPFGSPWNALVMIVRSVRSICVQWVWSACLIGQLDLVPAIAQTTSPTDATRAANEPVDGDPASRLTYQAPKTIEMLVGLRVAAGDGNMMQTTAMTVFPTSWPEQSVEIVQINVPPPFRYGFRDLPGGNRQILFQAQLIPASAKLEATVQLRIEKRHIVGPEETTDLIVPRRLPSEANKFLGKSPYIDTGAAELRRILKEIDAAQPLTEWKKIEMCYDWVRENIAYERGELKSVRAALRDRSGDCEEMTSTFVALCRTARIPARCVWLPNHCYAEFYMQDEAGNEFWFPCQLAGTRSFGSMPEYLPILQKGDRFKVPEKPELQRYLADYLASKAGYRPTRSTGPVRETAAGGGRQSAIAGPGSRYTTRVA